MITDNKYLTINKAGDVDLAALASGGLLPPAYQRQFYVRTIESAKGLPQFTIRPMGAPSENLPAIKFNDYVLAPGLEGTALPDASKHLPLLTQPVLAAHEFKGEVAITREALKDNVQNGTLLNLCMDKLPAAIARDMERIIFRGDVLSTTPVEAVMDGVLKQAITNTYAGGGVKISGTQCEAMFALLRNEYKEDPTKLKFFTAPQAERAWQNTEGERLTPGGDEARNKWLPAMYHGTKIEGLGAIPVSANRTSILLCDPKNIVVGIWQDVQLKIVLDEIADRTLIKVYVRFDVKFQDELAVVKATDVSTV